MDPIDRPRRVLAALVREYIDVWRAGALVGPCQRRRASGVSSATVRSILARLEEEGFVQQPHTSAGRIPTDRGYRFYVDLLLESKRSGADGERGRGAAAARQRRPLVDSVLSQASHVVSQASRHVGFALRPAHEAAVFDRVEFIPLERDARAGGHRRARRPCHPEGHRRRRAARRPTNCGRRPTISTSEFSGLPLHRAREAVLERMNEERLLYDALMARAMRLASSTFTDLPEERELYVDGAASLLGDEPAAARSARCSALLQMIEEKQRLVRLLNEYIDGPGLTVVIGAEHPDPSLRPFSLVASTYDDGDGHRHDRRHRPDAHALLARHRGGRRRGAGGVARAARSQLGTHYG